MAPLSRPARLRVRVEGGQPSRPRVYCGSMDCGTQVATVRGTSFTTDTLAMAPHDHTIEWAPSFRRGDDGIMRLSMRAASRWRDAKRERVSWHQFVDRGGLRPRRPYVPRAVGPGSVAGFRKLGGLFAPTGEAWHREISVHDRFEVTSGPVAFVCPVCGQLNTVDIADAHRLFSPCPMCQPALPPDDGDYVVEPSG
jgi:hypothetical protein